MDMTFRDLPWDEDTGEIFDVERLRAIERQYVSFWKQGYLQPLDTSEFVNKQGLLRRKNRYYLNGKCPTLDWIDLNWALEQMPHPQVRLLAALGRYVVFHGYAIIEPEVVTERLGWKTNMFNKQIAKAVEVGHLKVYKVDTDVGKLVELHPFFKWVGSRRSRTDRLGTYLQ